MAQINDRSDQAFTEMEKISTERLRKFAEVMTEKTKDGSPFQTGHNKRSITFDETIAGLSAKGIAFGFRVFTESGYGAFLELGTARRPATPYFRPAFDATKREVLK